MLLSKGRKEKGGWVCPMCGLHVGISDPVRMQALWQIHLKSHDEDLIENLEAMLERFAY